MHSTQDLLNSPQPYWTLYHSITHLVEEEVTGRNLRRRMHWMSCRINWWAWGCVRLRLKLNSERSNLKACSWRPRLEIQCPYHLYIVTHIPNDRPSITQTWLRCVLPLSQTNKRIIIFNTKCLRYIFALYIVL